MTIEDEVRAIAHKAIWDLRVSMEEMNEAEDEAVTALMRLIRPPNTGAPIGAQIEAVRSARHVVHSARLGYVREVSAALKTLQWVETRQIKEG